MTEDQRMQMMFTGIANCYCAERTLAWSRNQLLTIINLGGLPILAAPQVPMLLRYLVGILGIGVVWFLVLGEPKDAYTHQLLAELSSQNRAS